MEEAAKRLEGKLGFDRVRSLIADRCSTDYAAERVENEELSTDPSVIRKRLQLTDEMRLILMFEENFPTSGYIDCLHFLEPIGKNASIDLLSLGRLRTMLDTLRKVTNFFRGIKDGIYPGLKQLASGFPGFPEIQRRIDGILDKYGEIKDTASDKLYEIRTTIREREINVSKRMNAILRKAQQDGLVEADASVSIRDGKMLIPVASAKKRQFPGFVYDESATGKTTFVEPRRNASSRASSMTSPPPARPPSWSRPKSSPSPTKLRNSGSPKPARSRASCTSSPSSCVPGSRTCRPRPSSSGRSTS